MPSVPVLLCRARLPRLMHTLGRNEDQREAIV